MRCIRTSHVVWCATLGWLAGAPFGGSSAHAVEKLQVGQPLPAFSLRRADKPTRVFTAGQLLGKPAVLVFWRPHQELSTAALGDWQGIVRELGRSRFQVVGIDTAVSPTPALVAAMDEMELTFPVLLDPKRELYGKLGVIVSPTTFMFDADGVLRFAIPTRPPQYAQVVRAHMRFLVGDIDEEQMNKDVNPTVLAFEHDRAAAWRMYNLGKKAQDGGETEKARNLFEQSVSQYPALVEARCALGFLRLAAGDYRGAGNQFEFALGQQSTLPEALLGRAVVLARTGSGAEAETILLALLDRHSIGVRTRYELGRIYEGRRELGKAARYYHDALSIVFPEGKP